MRASPAAAPQERKAPLLARIAGIGAVLVLGGVLVVWGVDLGQRIFGASQGQSEPGLQQQLDQAQEEIARLTAERDALKAAAGSASASSAGAASATSATPATSAAASAELAAAKMENGKLAADLALAEKMLPVAPSGAGLMIHGVQARMATPRLVHYTVMLGYGPKKGASPRFEGRLGVVLAISRDGKQSLLEFPVEKDAARYDITVERNQRLDGTLELPDGTVASVINVSISAKGKVVAKQSAGVVEYRP